jgi:AcrR family transcriptional regulator
LARITKGPAERKSELIDVAERLFLERGYENTTVSDIVKEVGVAQGTFYYYFASKHDVLDAVIEREIDEPEREIMAIAHRADEDAEFKLREMADVILRFQTAKRGLIEHVHEESNAVMHEKMERRIIARLAPTMTEVIEEGIAREALSTDYPEETAEFLIAAMIFLFHQPDMDEERHERLHAALQKILDRIFGFSSLKRAA